MKKRLLSILITVLLLCGIGNTAWKYNPFTSNFDYTLYTGTTATGDILYHNGTIWTVLNVGANGTVLTVVAGVPTWAGGGGVLPISTVQFSVLVADAVGGWAEDTLFRVNAGNVVAGAWTSTVIANTYGGTGQNSAAWTGVPAVAVGVWSVNAQVPVTLGGTGVATLLDHGIMLGSGAAAVTVSAVGAGGQLFQSLGAGLDPAWTTSTWPATTTINQILYSIAANSVVGLATANSGLLVTSAGGVPSIATDIPTAVTIGGAYVYRVGGTDVSMADGGTSASLAASNGGIVYSGAAAFAVLAGTATANQALLSGAAAAPSWSTATYPATTVINQILYSSANNTIVGLATGNSSVLVTSAGGVPSLATDIPTAVTIGAAYIYRVGGTDVAVGDGGTGVGVWVTGDIVYASGVGTLAGLADVAVNQVLASGGVGVAPAYTATPTVQTLTTTDGIDVNSDGGTGEVGIDFNSINNTFATLTQSDAEGVAGSSDTRWGLDETLRNFHIMDRGDLATDLGRAGDANPALFIWDATAADFLRFYHDGTRAQINTNVGHLALMPAAGSSVGVSETGPARKLHVEHTSDGIAGIRSSNVSAGTSAETIVELTNNTGSLGQLGLGGGNHATAYIADNVYLTTIGDSHDLLLGTESATADVAIYVGGQAAANEVIHIYSTGIVSFLRDDAYRYIGAGNDAGDEYDENGDDTWAHFVPAAGLSLRTTAADTDNAGLIRVVKVIKLHSSDLFDAAALTDSANIWAQPAGSVMLSAKYVLDVQFVAVGMTDLDVTLGLAGDNTGVLNPAAHNLTSDAVGTEYTTRGAYWSATTVAGYHSAGITTWVGYATAVGANLSTTSAGSITFYFMYIDFPGT